MKESLAEVNQSIDTTLTKGKWKKLFAFLGPAYLVSVGYMDPGNWATDIAGGSQFGYKLIWVLLMSNLMALLLQSLSARLGLVRKMDLAQASRATYPRLVNFFLYLLAEIAIVAMDLAEVLGMAIGLQLLFNIPLLWGVSITVLDTLVILVLQGYGMRKMEAFILGLVAIIGGAFFVEMIFAKPDMGELVAGFIPSLPNNTALYIAIGIIGATVMPHNLYLHSSLVQTRRVDASPKGIWQAIRYNIIDSFMALNMAFFVNAAILVLAAATFYKVGMYHVAEIQDAHKLLAPLLGTQWAAILFAVALIAAGQSSTITGTLAGQIVMEGYLNLRIAPWLRRMITRLIAIVPAFLVILYYGEKETGPMLVFSQVVLSLQLGFAIIPLIHLVSDQQKMGEFAIGKWTKLAAWLIAGTIVALNLKLVVDEISVWLSTAGSNKLLLQLTVLPLALGALLLLIYITFKPLLRKSKPVRNIPHLTEQSITMQNLPAFSQIAISIDFTNADQLAINNALKQGGKDAHYTLIHIVETAGARLLGGEIDDFETASDAKNLELYASQLQAKGFKIETLLGHGQPKHALPRMVNARNFDLLVMGTHGHGWLKDLIFGTTIGSVRHKVNIPLLVINTKSS